MPITEADIRAIATALPEVTERAKRRRDGTTAIHFETARTMFVKLYEAGDLPPGIGDVIMIRRCPDRAALLAAAPERFFVTPHYAASSAVLTRLSTNRRRDLPELAELIEESWRSVATKRALRMRYED